MMRTFSETLTCLKQAILTRRNTPSLAVAAALAVAPMLGSAEPALAAPAEVAQEIADKFSSVRSMSGEFVQFGPRGEQTGGKFYIQRPGKIRFNYDAPSAYRVISDGKSVVIDNKKLNTSDLYPLSKTPLKLLLDDRIVLSGKRLKKVTQENDMTTVTLADKSVFGNSTITLMFEPGTHALKQWTIRDASGKDTTVMIFNVKEGVKIDPGLFKIDYKRNFDVNQKNGSNR